MSTIAWALIGYLSMAAIFSFMAIRIVQINKPKNNGIRKCAKSKGVVFRL